MAARVKAGDGWGNTNSSLRTAAIFQQPLSSFAIAEHSRIYPTALAKKCTAKLAFDLPKGEVALASSCA